MSDENTNNPEGFRIVSTPTETKPRRKGRPLKYDTNYVQAGRPTKSLKKKVGQPFRFLTTVGVRDAIEKFASDEGINISGVGRLSLYVLFILTDQITPEMLKDGTFDEMRLEFAASPKLGELVREFKGKEFVDALYKAYHSEEE